MVTNDETTPYTKMLNMVTDREKVIHEKWLKKEEKTFDLYEGGRADETPFNILYSNTEILVPNLFSSAPKPIIRRRFGEVRADNVAKAAERMADYCMDTNLSGYPEFVEAIEAAVLCAALPGQGQCRARVVDGLPVIDYVQHDEYIWGYAKRWEDVPWIAYRHNKTLDDLKTQFSLTPEEVAKVQLPEESSTTKDKGPATLPVYEVWNKKDRKIYFLCAEVEKVLLQESEDVLKLSGFFASGKPLRLVSTPASTMPRSMYGLYKAQAEELNRVTGRIKRITEAIQVKGIFDGTLPEMQDLFSSTDMENKLIPASNPGGMAREGGLDRHIWLIPVEKLITVLQQLYQIREQIKSTIYEILGIGDILRGVSAASETASAQQIKDKWGSLRIKKSRERVSAFVRWHVRALIELAATHTDEQVWAQVTGMTLPTSQEAAIAQQTTGQAPAESWATVLGPLRDDSLRSYIIDIETNSTVDGDATEEKAEVADFMNALGQSMPAIEGLASQGPEGHAAAQALLVEICKRFRMGSELQSLIMQIKPQEKGPTEEQQKAQQELDKKRGELDQAEASLKQQGEQVQQQTLQGKQQLDQLSQSLQQQQNALDKAVQELELARKEFELGVTQAQLELDQKALTLNQQSMQTETAQAQKDLEFQSREQGLTAQQAASKIESDKTEAVAATTEATTTTLAAVVKAIESQNAITQKLLETLANPPKMVIKKTGPSTFERTAE